MSKLETELSTDRNEAHKDCYADRNNYRNNLVLRNSFWRICNEKALELGSKRGQLWEARRKAGSKMRQGLGS